MAIYISVHLMEKETVGAFLSIAYLYKFKIFV